MSAAIRDNCDDLNVFFEIELMKIEIFLPLHNFLKHRVCSREENNLIHIF